MRHLWNVFALLTFLILCSRTVFGVRCYKNAIDDEIDGCYYCGVHQLTTVAVNFTSVTIFHNCVMTVQNPYNLDYLNKKINRSRVDGYETILLCDTNLCNLDVLHAPGGNACRGGLNFGLAIILICFYLRSYVLT
uniref:Protein quiver n=1 Tax=Panagrellus redivivus TaxID=6233 RepID=A0A7E5A0J4_PANRE